MVPFTTVFIHISWMMFVHAGVIILQTVVPFAEETTNAHGYVPTVCAHAAVCLVVHILCVYYGTVGTYDHAQETDMGLNVTYILCSSFIYEFILGWYGNKTVTYETIVHHLIGLITGTYAGIYRGKLMYWVCRCGILEASTVFLDILYVFNCCPGMKKTYSRAFIACQLTFACIFLYLRVWLLITFTISFMYEDADQYALITPFVLAMTALNLYWGMQVAYKLCSTLQRIVGKKKIKN